MAQALKVNPTLLTIRKVQGVLQDAERPISRYEIHKRLLGSVNYPVIDAVLDHLAKLRLIVDEGAGGKVLWVHATSEAARKLFRASRRVA
jgi:hypothetical protein